jgi:hypothetical protein
VEVVELKHERIALAAVDTGMISQVLDQIADAFENHLAPPAVRRVDVLLFVRRVVLLLIRRATWTAVVVSLAPRFSAPGEFLQWLFLAASSTSPHISNLAGRTDVRGGSLGCS